MRKINDLSGQRFGRLTVIELAKERKNGRIMWICQCECGNYTEVRGTNLSCGHIKSCGCLKKEYTSSRSTHKQSQSRLYGVWHGMINRCYNPKTINYKDYGGRGITVCEEWRSSFQSFSDWAYSNGYDKNAPRNQCTLDRINPNGDYCPENCRWATWDMQMNNTRKSNNRSSK